MRSLYSAFYGTDDDFDSRFREPFDMEDFVRFLENQRSYDKSELDSILLRTMRNENFVEHLFPTGKDKPADGLTEKMYMLLVKKRVLKSICRVLEEHDPRSFSRSIATWLYSVITVAASLQEKRWTEYKKEYSDVNPRKDLVGASDARRDKETLNEYDAILYSLTKLIRKIVRRDVKNMVLRANVPESLAEQVLVGVPDKEYVSNFRVGFYLNQVLLSLYRFVDDHHYDTRDVNWREFFKILFGEKNVVEAANFILLEGVHRIDDYGKDVEKTFNNITMFALKELEKAPETLKTQMLDLYVKRISKMFANKTFDLRANLLDLSPELFPKLVAAVKQYAPQISEIVYKGLKPSNDSDDD